MTEIKIFLPKNAFKIAGKNIVKFNQLSAQQYLKMTKNISKKQLKYRLYIDESGSHHYPSVDWDNMAKRYLSLTGVIIERFHYKTFVQPLIREIKELLASDPDDLPVLHRNDILNFSGDYLKLKKDIQLKNQFDQKIQDLLGGCEYKICVVVLDKKTHLDRYQKSALNPYNYSLAVLLERYIFFLEQYSATGDVMVESRGGKDDQDLEKAYKQFYENGTYYIKPTHIQPVLTSNSLKIRSKKEQVGGLEIADLLTLSTKIDALHTYGVIPKLLDNFQTKIIRMTQGKYLCHPDHEADPKGVGKKLIK